jgi:adenine-specific DNA-methyltransferase
VQCIYIDPPYGIKFNSNFQWSTTEIKVQDGKADHFSREPEQVKAFRDTWADGIHSYLTYLRDRLTVARDLLTPSGSLFVQIGDENVHRVRALMDEVFGEENFIALITFKKTNYQESTNVANIADYLLLFARDLTKNKHRKKFAPADLHEVDYSKYTKAFTSDGIQAIPKEWRDDPSQFEPGWRPLRSDITLTQDGDSGNSQVDWIVDGKPYLHS